MMKTKGAIIFRCLGLEGGRVLSGFVFGLWAERLVLGFSSLKVESAGVLSEALVGC